MITTFYPPYSFGGDGICVQRLANALAKRGHRVDVVHCRDAHRLLAGKKPVTDYDDHPNVTVHGLKSPWGFLSPLSTQQTGLPGFKSSQLRQIMKREFDVIHYHNVSLMGGAGVMELGAGIKLCTLHDYWFICPTHVMFKFNRNPCTRQHCFVCSLTYKRPPEMWRHLGLLRKAARHVNAFIAPSRFAEDMHRRMGFDVPFVRLPNFVPEVKIASALSFDVAGPTEKPYFLFVGRLEKLKGLQTIIPIFRRYEKAQLLIAGSGSDEPWLRRLAAGCDNIRFLGYIGDFGKLQALYRKAIAVVLPSLCYETFALVLAEAFQQKTPVIVRNLGAMAEIIDESGGGFAYDAEAELVAAIDQLMASPRRRRELGLRGYRAYQKHWTTEVHLRRYLALIEEIARQRRDSPSGVT
jgi:glycosyltransferase involved in cell wall biosynthesis